MWIYSQTSGKLWNDAGECIGVGYSGFEEGKNNPRLQDVVNLGPIPRGLYHITQLYHSKKVGRNSLKLAPVGHDALKRTNLVMHGDSVTRPGYASKGCVVQKLTPRLTVWRSSDHLLKVIE